MDDRAGIALAAACALHCIATPMLAASLQVAGVFTSERTELVFLASSLLISGTTILATCLRRGARGVVWASFVVGASLLISARSGVEWAELMEQPLVLAGAGLIVMAHVANLFYCRCSKEEPSCVGSRIIAALCALLVGLAAVLVAS